MPVLRRHRDIVQIGLDGRHAVLVEDVRPPTFEALLDLSGSHTLAELRARLAGHGDQADELVVLLGDLVRAGLVEDSVPPPHGRLTPETTDWALRTRRGARHVPAARDSRSVLVHGDGRLAVAVASALAGTGVGHVRVVAGGRVGPEDTGTGYLDSDVGRPRAEAAREAVKRTTDAVRVAPAPPDLVILADALVPAPELVASLVSKRTPHLAVRVREGLGLVGPLVVPGRSSCLRCADMHRAERDHAWPLIAAQLVGRVQHADLATTTATVGHAVAQALLALDHGEQAVTRPPTWDAVLEVDAYHGRVEHVISPVHPRCECRSALRPDGAV
ncbi:TOMM precursor leader peptide-binding protein [Actinosynnema sp. NPDC020468]|uniref:TOMM precursor leader peptide-binding protein n=1 Tax=Actinosynnema sp. NPDC020468 TaxID=3154488 RepID=UPI0033ED80FD